MEKGSRIRVKLYGRDPEEFEPGKDYDLGFDGAMMAGAWRFDEHLPGEMGALVFSRDRAEFVAEYERARDLD